MSVLEQLPLEIATEIFSYLPCADLLNLSTLSHHIHTVSQPLLFKNPTLTSADGETKSPLQGLLEVLLSPAGATLVKHVRSLHVQWGTGFTRLRNIPHLTEAASRLGLHLPIRSEEGQLVLLLHLLPYLRDLNLSSCGEGDDRFIRFIATQTPGTTLALGFQNLRRFRCAPESSPDGITPSILLTLLHLPCMREIDVCVIDVDTIALPAFEAAASTSGVTHLRLVDTELSEASLARILAVPAALTHFTYRLHSRTFDIVAFRAALQQLQHALQVLHLDISGPGKASPTPTDARIGSLREWRVLRDVRGPLMAFLGQAPKTAPPALAEVLPVGIREFEVLADVYWSVTQEQDKMMELVMMKAERVPGLMMLTAGLGGRPVLRSRGSLVEACERADVRLRDNSTYRNTVRTATRGRQRTRQSCCRRIRR